jgi:hypothetical protein
MVDAINTLRATGHVPTEDVTEREERLWVLHEKFTGQIVDCMAKIDRTYEVADGIYDRIIECLADTKACGASYGRLQHRYAALADVHAFIGSLRQHNLAISHHLSTLSFSFGQNILHASDPAIENCVRAIQTERAPPREDDEGPHLPRSCRADQQRPGRRRRKPALPKTISQSPSVGWQRPNPIEGAAPSQLLDFMALTHRLQTGDGRYHEIISETLKSALAGMFGNVSDAFRQFHGEMGEGIRLATRGSVEVLRRGKADVEVQAGSREFRDVELAMDPPEVKPRGKKSGGRK